MERQKSKGVRREEPSYFNIYIYIPCNPPRDLFALFSPRHCSGSPCSFLFPPSLPPFLLSLRSFRATVCSASPFSHKSFSAPVHLRKGGKGGVSARAKSGVCAFLRVNVPPKRCLHSFLLFLLFHALSPFPPAENLLSS